MRQFYIWTLFSVSWYSAVAAQDLQPPAAWRSPNITLSREDCINIARAALETAISNLNQSAQFGDNIYESPGRLYAQMAEFDRLTNQTKYKDMLKQYFLLAEFTRPGFLDLFLQSGMNYGYAAVRAYSAYQDPDFLAFAVTAWTSARRYTISEDEDELGTMDTKQFTYPSSCQGETLTGGTYFASDPYNTNIASTSSGFFFVLSALLAKATSNNTYIDAAVESAHFIQSHLLNISNSVVLGSIEPSPNCAVDASNLVSDCAGSGLFIEGMVVLADIMAYNTSTIDLLRSTIVDVTSNSLWHEVNRVYDSADSGGHYIIEALASIYERNSISSDLREYIKAYIGVQYNTIIEQARFSSVSSLYGLPWTGPPGSSFEGTSQTVALTVSISAIQLADNPTSNKEFVGIIAGSVSGGITLLAASILGSIFLCKLHRRRNGTPLVVDESLPVVIPFTTAQNMSSSGILGEQHPGNQAKAARLSAVASGSDPSPLEATENGNHATGTDNPPVVGRREYTLMEELLKSLNDWRSRNPLNAEEMPPGYHDV